MSSILFGRKVRFKATHHYQRADKTAQWNRDRFGEAGNVHEHEWELTIWLQAPIDMETGMMVDLGDVDAILQREVTNRFHKGDINRADPYFANHPPTTEVLAGYFAKLLANLFLPAELVRLRVAESEDLFSEWLS